MSTRPIRTQQEYEAALRTLSAYFDNEPSSKHGERFAILLALVETYETQHFSVGARQKTLSDRLAASPVSPEQWSRDTEFLQDGSVGLEPS
jgi:antitoxin component HigA of HigAB toxin-antitoxin module